MINKDLTTKCPITWCPGCGNFGIWAAVKAAAVKENWDNTNTALVTGIGCHGHILNFVRLTSFESLHGRAIPVATGIKLANQKLNTFVFTGDGDCFGEGGNHFLHACRRNHDLNIIIHDNALYSLTTGQTSPTSPHGLKTKSTPAGNPDEPVNPIALAIVSGATFVARGYTGDILGLTDSIIKANQHKGLSVIDVLQPCVTFNKTYTHQFFQENTYKLGADYDPTNKIKAIEKAFEWGEKKIGLGVFYQEEKPLSEPIIFQSPIKRDLTELLKKYR